MVEQGLHLLGLHIIWMARSSPDVNDSSKEEEPAPTAKDGKGKGNTKTRAKSSVKPGAFLSVHASLMPTLARRPSPHEIVAREMISIHDDGIDILRASRAGAVYFKHSDILLANLGPSFDLCTKVIIDVLRTEACTTIMATWASR
jgi:hypothetical protein